MRRALSLFALAGLAGLAWLAGCASPGRLAYDAVPSQAMNGVRMQYSVYTPPDFQSEERLPLVVFLHGGGDGPDAFDRHGVSSRLEAAMRREGLPRAVIVLPEGDLGFWANWADGTRRYEDWVVDELVPRVREALHTGDCPEHCHVMGVSMGGIGALRFALHRPRVFSTAGSLSGPVMSERQMISFAQDRLLAVLIPTPRIFGAVSPGPRIAREDLYQRWTSPERTRLRRIFLAWGTRDRDAIIEGGRALHRHLEQHGVEHRWHEYEGDHSWRSWTPVIERALRHQIAGE